MFKGLFRNIRNNILVGVILVTPLVITAYVISFLFQVLTNSGVFKFLSQHPAIPESASPILRGIMAVLLVLIALFCIGLFVKNILGRRMYSFGDRLIGRIPFINKIYMFVRNVSEAIVAQRDTMFQEVVLVEYPRIGLFSIAFVTAEVPPQIKEAKADEEVDDLIYLFIPTTPNPTSGILIMSRRSEVSPLDLSTADAMKLVISAGAVNPGQLQVDNQRPRLLEKVEGWLESRKRAWGERKKGKDS